ncbi:MAG: hypothetical protein MK010_00580 [Erythrobacter sp.]|nr:hypothetical protein [Erythrobacter sp.]
MAQAATVSTVEEIEETESSIVTVSRSLDVPDEIVPAVMPYMMCVTAKQYDTVESDGRPVDLTDQPENCDELRTDAVEYGAELYRKYGVGDNGEDRRDRVLAFLDEFDEFQAPSQDLIAEPVTEQD